MGAGLAPRSVERRRLFVAIRRAHAGAGDQDPRIPELQTELTRLRTQLDETRAEVNLLRTERDELRDGITQAIAQLKAE